MGQTLELGSRQLTRYLHHSSSRQGRQGAANFLSSLSSSMTGPGPQHDGTQYDLPLHRHRQLVCVTQLDDKAWHAQPTGSEQRQLGLSTVGGGGPGQW